MKFLQRNHYCNTCEKTRSFLHFNTKKKVVKKYKCPSCNNEIISYWEQLSNMYAIPLTLGFSFFVSIVIYNTWRYFTSDVETVDYFITGVYLVLTIILAVFATTKRNKSKPKTESDYTLKEFKAYRMQFLFVFLFIAIVIVITVILATIFIVY